MRANATGRRTRAFASNPVEMTELLTARRVFIAVLALVGLNGLLGVAGQGISDSSATGPAATLRLSAPERVRGGLRFQSRLEVEATQRLRAPRLVLDRGWTEGMRVTSIEPAATSEVVRDGRLLLSYDTLEPGDVLRIWLRFEVDPTGVGRRPFGVELGDGTGFQARIDRDIRVLP